MAGDSCNIPGISIAVANAVSTPGDGLNDPTTEADDTDDGEDNAERADFPDELLVEAKGEIRSCDEADNGVGDTAGECTSNLNGGLSDGCRRT